MFVPRGEAPKLFEDGVHALCLSLNSPVVHSAGLPLGPARAAIALHATDAGEPALTVLLRSLEDDCTSVFEYEGELLDAGDAADTIDIALSFGESLGFLFDDDLIASGTGSRSVAVARWRELLGEKGGATSARPAAEEPTELLLDVEVAETVETPLTARDGDRRAERDVGLADEDASRSQGDDSTHSEADDDTHPAAAAAEWEAQSDAQPAAHFALDEQRELAFDEQPDLELDLQGDAAPDAPLRAAEAPDLEFAPPTLSKFRRAAAPPLAGEGSAAELAELDASCAPREETQRGPTAIGRLLACF